MFTVTLIPGTFWASTDNVTDAKLNLTANPTISVSGSVADITDYSAVTATTKTFTVFNAASGILRVASQTAAVGQRVKVSSSGTLPGLLVAGTEYFLKPDTTNPGTDFTLHYSLAGAVAGTERVDMTAPAGSGTHTLTYFTYATGAPFIFDSGGSTWEKGIVSPENLPEFVGATSSAPGTRGAVPQAAPSERAKFLRGDGTWTDPTAGVATAGNLFLYYATI